MNATDKHWMTVTKVRRLAEPMVDWYHGTEAEARAAWDEDCHRYGLPMADVTVEFIEVDPVTLRPLAPRLWVCAKCGHEVLDVETPSPIRWDDGHVCFFRRAS